MLQALLRATCIRRSLERMGDHAKNIAEYVVQIVEGIDPRHGLAAAARATR